MFGHRFINSILHANERHVRATAYAIRKTIGIQVVIVEIW